ncbi:siderophore-interacting protein [Leucobacter iarius]|uniref:Siderophore-interacting protein n=1 Tax=Leucobacter iarius TaxID=333963 RepID=A0ABN2LQ67_9MICO
MSAESTWCETSETMRAEVPEPPGFVIARAAVDRIDLVSPTFARITFTGAELEAFGTPGRVLDQRIKLIFPGASGRVPDLSETDDWYRGWLDLPEDERGSMRTYSIRELRVEPGGTRVVVDFVLHLQPGATGPASSWAAAAKPGDELLLVGPRRGGPDWGGIEFDDAVDGPVLLAGDETAAPAIARILEDVAPGTVGTAWIEVPHAEDRLPIAAPAGVEVRWLLRGDDAHGAALIPALLAHVGLDGPAGAGADADTEAPVWETPTYSNLEEAGYRPTHSPTSQACIIGSCAECVRSFDARILRARECRYWIAGESGVVTTLRRHLVRECGVDRSRVAFMGYWRRGVAMRG